MSGDATLDVFGLGQCAYDHLLLVPRHGHADEKVEGHGLRRQTGGPVATALAALSHWGRRTAFAGVVGGDDAGRHILADLVASGVDVEATLSRPDTGSQEAFVAVEEGSGRRRIAWQRPTGSPPGADEIPLRAARVFLTDGLFVEAALRHARDSRCVVVDAGTMREGTRALMGEARIFVASASFARDLVGGDDPQGACRVLHEQGVEVAGVTLGERGWVASVAGRPLEGRAHPAAVVDTTGCGDVFHAGVVEGVLAGWSWPRTFDFAAWAAARCAEHLGGRDGIPTREAYPAADAPAS